MRRFSRCDDTKLTSLTISLNNWVFTSSVDDLYTNREVLDKLFVEMISTLCLSYSLVNYIITEWASCQIRKIVACACAENAGNVFPPLWVSDPDMHHGTCVKHVPWCMPGSLTSGFRWSQLRGERSRHSQRMRNLQFYVSGKRSIGWGLTVKEL